MERETVTAEELASAEAAVNAQPDNVRLKQKLASLYIKSAQRKKALSLLTKLIDSLDAEEGELKLSVLRQMVKLEPFELRWRKSMAALLTMMGHRGEATEQLQLLSDLAEETNKPAEAVWALERVSEFQPLSIPGQVRLAELYVDSGSETRAALAYDRVLEQLESKSYWSDYRKVAERLLQLVPGRSDVRKVLARLYLEKGQVEQAIVQLQKAFRTNSRDPETLDMLAIAYDAMERSDKVISVLKELGEIYEEDAKLERAEAVYHRILEVTPESQTAIRALERLEVKSRLWSSSQEAVTGLSLAPLPDDEGLPFVLHGASTPGGALPLLSVPEISMEVEEVGTNEELSVLQAQLISVGVPADVLTLALLRAISKRPVLPGQPVGPWPSSLVPFLGREWLLDGHFLMTDVLPPTQYARCFRAIDVFQPGRFVHVAYPHLAALTAAQQEQCREAFSSLASSFVERSHPALEHVLSFGLSSQNQPFIVSEFDVGLPLVRHHLALTTKQISNLFYNISQAVSYIHSLGLLHGCLTSERVLLINNHECKLASGCVEGVVRGWASLLGVDVSAFGLEGFERNALLPDVRPPEEQEGAEPSREGEVFRLGCLLYYLSNGRLPDSVQDSDASEGRLDTLGLGLPSDEHGQFLNQLFPMLCQESPEKRMTLRDLHGRYVAFVRKEQPGESGQKERTLTFGSSPMFVPIRDIGVEMGGEVVNDQVEEAPPFHLVTSQGTPETSIRLPESCLGLPLERQEELLSLIKRGKSSSWFSIRAKPVQGIALLREHILRLREYVSFPLQVQLSYVRTSWSRLTREVATQKEIDRVATKVSSRILRDEPGALARAGQVAWSALDQHVFSKSVLLPFDIASEAISGIGWSVAHASDWAAAHAKAKETARRIADKHKRSGAWEAARSIVWRSVWPSMTAIARQAESPVAQLAARVMSHYASSHGAWLVIDDCLEGKEDPFAPLFEACRLGFYPMLLHNGDFVLVMIDEEQGDEFRMIQQDF